MSGTKKNPSTITSLLQQRIDKGSLRSLISLYPKIDFSSNDYLGFSSKGLLNEEVKKLNSSIKVGSTGSRLISGNSNLFNEIENDIAKFHHSESALIYNSGYDANLGLLSSVPQKGDLILSDELIHASLIDGIRLSFATHYKFKHNDTLWFWREPRTGRRSARPSQQLPRAQSRQPHPSGSLPRRPAP